MVVVSENFAREYLEGAGGGARQADPADTPSNPWRTIVGVVGRRARQRRRAPAPEIVYWPLRDRQLLGRQGAWSQRNMGFAIRTDRAESPTLLKEIQQAVWSVNGNLPVASGADARRDPRRVDGADVVRAGDAEHRGGVALLLGVVGIYGVISYIATQRTREIGIRIALGAARRRRQHAVPPPRIILAASALHSASSAPAALTRLMSTLLFGVSPMDSVTYVSVASGLAATALLASYLPAMRAARTDPAIALRYDI